MACHKIKFWDKVAVMRGDKMVYPQEKASCWSALAMQGVKAVREAQKPHVACTVPEQNTHGWRLV